MFLDTTFPDRIALGAKRNVGWHTTVVTTASGTEKRNQDWSRSRYSFDIGFAIRTIDDADAIVAHFHEQRARAHTFGFKDHQDFRCTAADGVLSFADASDGGFVMFKQYGEVNPYLRRITRPVTGTVAIFQTTGPTTTNITTHATIDYETGAVQVDTDIAVDTDSVFSWSGEFNVPCRYDIDELPSSIVNRKSADDGDLLVSYDAIPIIEDRDGA